MVHQVCNPNSLSFVVSCLSPHYWLGSSRWSSLSVLLDCPQVLALQRVRHFKCPKLHQLAFPNCDQVSCERSLPKEAGLTANLIMPFKVYVIVGGRSSDRLTHEFSEFSSTLCGSHSFTCSLHLFKGGNAVLVLGPGQTSAPAFPLQHVLPSLSKLSTSSLQAPAGWACSRLSSKKEKSLRGLYTRM